MATEEERKKKFEEDITKKINELPLEIRIKALALRNYLNEKNALDEQLDKETINMHKLFEERSEPFYKKSNDIIDGKLALPEESLVDLDKYVAEAEKDAANAAKAASPLKEYWFKAMKNCDSIAQELKEKDFDALKHLVSIEVVKDTNEKDFTLHFRFSANDFFSNEVLTKKFFMKDSDTPDRSEGTEINWKDGKNLTKKQVKKKQKNKKSGQQRVVTKEVDDESFFNFFKTINIDEKELEKIEDDEEVEKIQERMDIDFEISQVILDELYPYSLEYYLGVKEAFGEDLHDHLEHEDAEDEEVEQEEAPKPKKKKNKKKKNAQKEGEAAPGGATQNPGQKPECAQSQT